VRPFEVLYADPPWQFGNKHTGGSMKSGAADKYATMPTNEIAAIPVQSITTDASLLALWVPASMMLEGLKVIHGWGYRF